MKTAFPNYPCLFEEVRATDLNDLKIDSLAEYNSESIEACELFSGDVIIYTRENDEQVTTETLEEAFETIDFAQKRSLILNSNL